MDSPPPEPGNVRRADTGQGRQISGALHHTPSIVVNAGQLDPPGGYFARSPTQ